MIGWFRAVMPTCTGAWPSAHRHSSIIWKIDATGLRILSTKKRRCFRDIAPDLWPDEPWLVRNSRKPPQFLCLYHDLFWIPALPRYFQAINPEWVFERGVNASSISVLASPHSENDINVSNIQCWIAPMLGNPVSSPSTTDYCIQRKRSSVEQDLLGDVCLQSCYFWRTSVLLSILQPSLSGSWLCCFCCIWLWKTGAADPGF